jgi:hypothetical protein
MSLKLKIPFICFLAISLFSLFLMSYTLYVTFGTRWATRVLTVSLTDVTMNESASRTHFSLAITNPTNIRLEIFFISVDIQFNNTNVGSTVELSYQFQPLELQTNVKTNVGFDIQLVNSTSYSNGFWNLTVDITLDTLLPQQTSVSREVSYEV